METFIRVISVLVFSFCLLVVVFVFFFMLYCDICNKIKVIQKRNEKISKIRLVWYVVKAMVF